MNIIPKNIRNLQNLFIEPKKSKKRRRNVIKKTLKEHVQSKADLFEEIKSYFTTPSQRKYLFS